MKTIRFTPPERRRHSRTQLHMTLHGIRLDPDGGDVRDTLEMVDISRAGMGATADRWLYPGQRIVLCLPLHPDGLRRNLYATIIRCRKAREAFNVGLEFDSVPAFTAASLTHVAAAA